MTKPNAIARMSEPQMRAWLLARMRGEREDPPVDASRLESPDDYVLLIHRAGDAKLRARIEKAALAALREAAAKNLRTGRNARAVEHLTSLVDSLALREAAPLLLEIADRGAFGGHPDTLEADAEGQVLFTLAGFQEPDVLWDKWLALWSQETPPLWAVVMSGLRLSSPRRALALLPGAIGRAMCHPDLPLGELLWVLATDEHLTAGEFASTLNGLTRDVLARCREALERMGAEPEELDTWIPPPSSPEHREVD